MPDILNRGRQRTGRLLRELLPHHAAANGPLSSRRASWRENLPVDLNAL